MFLSKSFGVGCVARSCCCYLQAGNGGCLRLYCTEQILYFINELLLHIEERKARWQFVPTAIGRNFQDTDIEFYTQSSFYKP